VADFTDETGAPIPAENLAEAVASGNAYGDANAEFSMRDAVGDVVKVRGAEVPKALAAGASLLSPGEADFESRRAEHQGTWAAARTLLERGASTATGGLTDLAAGLASPELARDMRERAVVQDSAGSFGGALGAAVPFSLAGKLAKPVQALARAARPTTAAGRMALRATAATAPYALEGAFYGASSAAGAAALQGDEITAEKVLSGAGKGALLGGLFGGAATALASRGARRIASKESTAQSVAREGTEAITGIRQKAGDFAAEGAIAGLRPSKRLVKEAAGRGAKVDEFIKKAGRDYLGYEMKTGPMKGKRIFHAARDPSDVLDDVSHAWDETGRTIGQYREMAAEAGKANPALRPSTAKLNDDLDEILKPRSEFAPKADTDLIAKVEREYLEPLRRWRDAKDPLADGVENSNYLRGGMRDLTEHRRAYEGLTPEQAEHVATGLAPTNRGKPFEPIQVHIDPEAGAVLQDGRHRMVAAKEAGAQNILATVKHYDDAGKVIRETTGPISIGGAPKTDLEIPDIEAIRRSVDTAQRTAKRTGNLAEADLLGRVNQRMTAHTDEALEAALPGVDLAPYKEAKSVYRSLTFVKKAAEELAFSKAAGGKSAQVDPSAVGYALSMLMMGHPVAAAGVAAAQMGQKLIRERAGGVISELAWQASKTDARIGMGARALADGVSLRGMAAGFRDAGISGVERYALNEKPQLVFERLREVAASPVKLQEYAARQTAPYAQQYPELAMAAQQLVMGDVQHLAATAPAGFTSEGAQMTPLSKAARERLFSHPDVRKWMDRAAVLEDPGTLVDEMLRGRVPLEAIETLKLRRPHIWAELRQEVQAEVAVRKDTLPFKRRILLGTGFEFASDYSMQASVAAELQMPTQAPAEQPQPTGDLKTDPTAMLTTTQRLESF
jgi:hypothetical protein